MHLATLTHVRTDHDPAGASLLSFRPDKPFDYRAGQFGLWIVGGSFRPFTIASTPGDQFIQLGTRLHQGSGIKRALSRLHPGDHARILGPFGHIDPADDPGPVIYAVQGIGVTPARSIIRAHPDRAATLIHVGSPYFRDELEPLATAAIYPKDRDAFTDALKEAASTQPQAQFVVAGSTAFTKSTTAALKALAIPAEHIHADGFIGLPD